MTNRFKGLDLIECLKNYEQRFVTLYRRQWSKPTQRKRNAKRQNGCLRRVLQMLRKEETMSSCPGLTPMLHSTIGLTAGSVEHSPLHQWKAFGGGHLHFREKKNFLQVCEYLWQQSHAMPLLHLMTSTNPKMDWCNTLHFNYVHNVTFNFNFNLF